jgi:hypothetical protein
MIIVNPDSSSAQVELYALGLPARDRPILSPTAPIHHACAPSSASNSKRCGKSPLTHLVPTEFHDAD